MSAGAGEPVELYCGADDRLDVLQQRRRIVLQRRRRTIYPGSSDVDRVEIDLLETLLEPGEYRPDEALDRWDGEG